MNLTIIIISTFILFSSCSRLTSHSIQERSVASVKTNHSCNDSIKSFFVTKSHDKIMDELENMNSIDEVVFNQLKLDFRRQFDKGVLDHTLTFPIEKVAYMEAYIEFQTKYPVSTSMIETHKALSKRYRRKLSKLLQEVDFDQKWNKRNYRKFIFQYYSILRRSDAGDFKMKHFSESIQKFILKRTEQQVLMDGFVKRGAVASRIKARVKMMISLALNITMFRKVGAFYSFYELKLFTPSDKIVDRIYKEGLFSVQDDLIKQYRVRAGIEVIYNDIRLYMVVTGMSVVATTNYIAYQETGEIPLDIRKDFRNYYSIVQKVLYGNTSKENQTKMTNAIRKTYEEELNSDSNQNDKLFIEDLLPK